MDRDLSLTFVLARRRTVAKGVNPLSLTHKTVYLQVVHLVHSGFRPAFVCNHSLDLLVKELDIFRVGKEAVQYLRERLRTMIRTGLKSAERNCLPGTSYG